MTHQHAKLRRLLRDRAGLMSPDQLALRLNPPAAELTWAHVVGLLVGVLLLALGVAL